MHTKIKHKCVTEVHKAVLIEIFIFLISKTHTNKTDCFSLLQIIFLVNFLLFHPISVLNQSKTSKKMKKKKFMFTDDYSKKKIFFF